MLLPAIQYGSWKEVTKRMRTVVSQLKRGKDLCAVMSRGGMLDSSAHTGMLVLSGFTIGTTPHFHCFLPWKKTWDALFGLRRAPLSPAPIEDAIFAASLRTPWGILGLLTSENQPWLYPTARHEPFLRAALAVWDELDAVGARYCYSVHRERLWSVSYNLHYVLRNMGVPMEILRAPLPPEGPRAVLKYIQPPR